MRREWAAWTGVVATAVGAGVGHVVAQLVAPNSSPVLAVAHRVIDVSPSGVKSWAIATFGAADKAVLIGGVVLVTLALGALAGVLAGRARSTDRRSTGGDHRLASRPAHAATPSADTLAEQQHDNRPSRPAHAAPPSPETPAQQHHHSRPFSMWAGRLAGVAVPAVLALICIAAALTDPAATPAWALPGLAAWASGLAALWFLQRPHPTPAPANGAALTLRSPAGQQLGRRRLLESVGVGGLAVVAGSAGLLREGAEPAVSIPVPTPATPRAPLPAGLERTVPGISPFVTPQADLFRVDVALSVPRLSPYAWSLTIDGAVARPTRLTWDDLLAHELIERDVTLLCVSNPIGGPYVGSGRWLGVRVADVLEPTGIADNADMVMSTSHDRFTVSTPLQALLDDRDALLAVGFNGEALRPEHGFPVRMITPGLYGYVGSTKWVTRLTVTRFDQQEAYWTKRGWAPEAPIKPGAQIQSLANEQHLPAGETLVGGVAWAQRHGVARVQLRIDGGSWRETEVGPDAGIDYWRQWYYRWPATTGVHTLETRLVMRDGTVQTDAIASVLPSGASGYHGIQVFVD